MKADQLTLAELPGNSLSEWVLRSHPRHTRLSVKGGKKQGGLGKSHQKKKKGTQTPDK